jgi:hypothetical protein
VSSASGSPEGVNIWRAAAEKSPPAEPRLLEKVLVETSEVLRSEEPLEDGDKESLSEVARRHRDQPLTLDPVATELVSAILRNHLRGLPGLGPMIPAMSACIARSLMDDPIAHARLGALWTRLGGENR